MPQAAGQPSQAERARAQREELDRIRRERADLELLLERQDLLRLGLVLSHLRQRGLREGHQRRDRQREQQTHITKSLHAVLAPLPRIGRHQKVTLMPMRTARPSWKTRGSLMGTQSGMLSPLTSCR